MHDFPAQGIEFCSVARHGGLDRPGSGRGSIQTEALWRNLAMAVIFHPALLSSVHNSPNITNLCSDGENGKLILGPQALE
jgi:hypothetical protein